MSRLRVIPLNLDEANMLVETLHRHHSPVVGHKFSLGACLGEKIVGAVIVKLLASTYAVTVY